MNAKQLIAALSDLPDYAQSMPVFFVAAGDDKDHYFLPNTPDEYGAIEIEDGKVFWAINEIERDDED